MKLTLNTNYVTGFGANSYLYKQILAVMASSMSSINIGITLGITSVMLPQLREDKTIDIDANDETWIASIVSIAMIVGALGCVSILDTCGRKASHLIFGAPFIIGWIIIACSNSTTLLLVGRFVTGISVGATRPVALVYIGEIIDPKIRAPALFSPGLMAHAGILLGHIIGHNMSWRITALVCIIPTLIPLICILFVKESPLWLISKGRIDEGIANFRWFRGTDESSELELKILSEKQSEKSELTTKVTLKSLGKMSFIKPMLILFVLIMNMQVSGVNVLVFYSQDLFDRAFAGKVDAYLLMIAMDCVRGGVAVICCAIGQFVPRKKTYLVCTFGVTIFIVAFVVCLLYIKSDDYVWVSVVFLVLYICVSSALGTIGWTFVPELLPNNARGLGIGINATIACILLFVIVNLTPHVMEIFGGTTVFGFYGVATLISGLVLLFVLPETNGKTLQTIEDHFNGRKVESTTKV